MFSAQAHFYQFIESQWNETLQLIRNISMPNFDMDLLEESRKGNFHSKFKPILSSFHGQVFVYGRHPQTGVGFMGHYGRLFLGLIL